MNILLHQETIPIYHDPSTCTFSLNLHISPDDSQNTAFGMRLSKNGCLVFDALNTLDGVRDLGLESRNMLGIVQTLCEDLLMAGFDGRSIRSHLDDGALHAMIAEVDEPHLQARVLRVAASVAHADEHLADGESALLDMIDRIWQKNPVTVEAVT